MSIVMRSGFDMMTDGVTTIYTYDVFNRLIGVNGVGVSGNAVDAQYTYRPDGLRIAKVVNGNRTTHLWDGANIVAELDNDNEILDTYIRGIGLIKNGQDQWFLFNARGDVVALTDEVGNVVREYRYDAFGNELNPDPDDTNPWRFKGEYFDIETGTIYLRARHFNPRIGRFTQPDPFWGIHNMQNCVWSIHQSANLFVFVMNNPIMFIDPSGENAYSVVHRHSGGFGLRVIPRSNEFSVRALEAMSFGGPLGRRAAGYRRISIGMDWGTIGLAGDAAWTAWTGISPLPGLPGLITSGIDVRTALRNNQWLIAETISNHFNSRLWISDTRNIVDSKFNYAMNAMTQALADGRIKIRNSTDVFGIGAFSGFPVTTRQFDPLFNQNRTFRRDTYYFFLVCGTAHDLIRNIQWSIVDQWGSWGEW